MNILKQKKLEN